MVKYFLSYVLLCCCAVVQASVYDSIDSNKLTPTIDINYRPDINTDEGGLWYQVDKIEQQVQSSPYLIRSEDFNEYLQDMVCRLSADYCPHIRVYLIDNPHFNASMYPNGMMHVWAGVLLRVSNEDELAAVLAHEIAHFLRTHQITQWRNLKNTATVAVVLDAVMGAFTGVYGLATLGAAGNIAQFSRLQEAEADVYGLSLMKAGGYNARAAVDLWEYINKERSEDKSKGSYSAFFASHPVETSRVEALDKLVPKSQVATKDSRLKQLVSAHYESLMRSHIQLQEYEQTALLLERHRQLGYPKQWIAYFSGELHRLRNEEGAIPKAIEAYQQALEVEPNMPEALRELAYMHVKANESQRALDYFVRYKQARPEASDIAMVDYYIKQLGGSL